MTEYIIKVKIDNYGTKTTSNSNDQLHSFNDEPAYIGSDGTKYWYKDGNNYTPVPKVLSCDGKVVEIEGKKYKLMEVK